MTRASWHAAAADGRRDYRGRHRAEPSPRWHRLARVLAAVPGLEGLAVLARPDARRKR